MRAASLSFALVCALRVQFVGALRAQEAGPVVVRVYEYAPAPAGAERSGEDIFRRAGVETRWTACIPSRGDCGDLRDGEILIKVVRRPWKTGPQRSSFGAAIVDEHSYLGWVFLDRVQQAARSNAANPGTVLAHVMAHEVAHLLGLPHAKRGIMRPEYDGGDIHAAETGVLQFTSGEAAELRDGVIRRRNRQFASTSGPPSPIP